jgi:TPP-dependent 2-oxoacid decarboxylase
VVLAGVEIHRLGLQQALQEVLKREGWPFATSLSGKSLLSEQHPSLSASTRGLGGAVVREVVEGSDGLLILGRPLSDLDTSVFTMRLNAESCLRVERERGLGWQRRDQGGCGMERPILDGPSNNVATVDHVGLAQAMGFQAARRVAREGELWEILQAFSRESAGPTLVSVALDPRDASDTLRNLPTALGRQVKAGVVAN